MLTTAIRRNMMQIRKFRCWNKYFEAQNGIILDYGKQSYISAYTQNIFEQYSSCKLYFPHPTVNTHTQSLTHTWCYITMTHTVPHSGVILITHNDVILYTQGCTHTHTGVITATIPPKLETLTRAISSYTSPSTWVLPGLLHSNNNYWRAHIWLVGLIVG